MDLSNIINNYENYDEGNRVTSNHARRMEFITTTHILDQLLGDKPLSILDCAAGTGIYSLYLANQKHRVAAVDITKDHIEILNQKLDGKRYDVDTAVNDTRGLDMFEDETFDVVLCMGPLYHLNEKQDRDLCFKECYRVLRTGGLLISSYLNRFFMIPQMLKNDFRLLNREFINSLRENSTLRHEQPFSFMTGSHCHTPDEIEEMYQGLELDVIDHLGTDGISPMIADTIHRMTDEEFDLWLDYHLSVCRERSILGMSNHGLIVGKK